MNLGIKGKTAVVMGASKGLGKASALALAQEGASLIICAREKTLLEKTALEIQKETGRIILAVPADVTKLKDLEKLVSKAADKFGNIDILVNNAGGPPPGTFEEITDSQWQKAFELNLLSTIRMTRLVIPYMKKIGKGRIINMVSVSAKQPVENLILSNAIRAGVLGMAKSLANELAESNITVNNILTGNFLTDRILQLYGIEEKMQQGMPIEEALKGITKDIPLQRLGKPEEFGSLVAFLASEQAAFITGTSIQIDGGLIRSTL